MATQEWQEVWGAITRATPAEESCKQEMERQEQGAQKILRQSIPREKIHPLQAQLEPVFSWDDVSVEFCHTLWMAVLKRAVEEYGILAKDEDGKIPAIAAERWIHSDMTSPGSLLWLCDMFDFDVVAIRTKYPKRIGDCSVCETHNCKECVMAQQELL